ncbi:MAG: Holliday junction branch migration protein RuvA [Roseburia sp.]|nr:Holliday junction branch migration protein RuvA [Ruminococcus sp.]MCM1154596.1 Holliday junction branch migration protein RuvA [Roseburia sp.]MCM1241681.1 Holliday junction branch migration protein RuvA [Roseburia sp.]
MYAYLKGTIEEIAEDNLVLEVGQIGYNVKVSARTINAVGGIGSFVKIYTYTLVREDAFWLYGFLTRDDLEIFKKLITVNGIGPKGGLAILSVMSADELRFAIVSGDAKAIAKAPGVGAKTAERVILDLKDKISLDDVLSSGEADVMVSLDGEDIGNSRNEAIEALTALGYSGTEALRAVKQVEAADSMSVEEILKAALKFIL